MSSSKDIEMQGRYAQRGASADDASPANAPGAALTDDGARDLLLGLLYGELDHEDATRAERRVREDAALTHELEGWERIRSLVRELPQEEPPDALSVKLLHAAAEASKSRGADQEAHGGVWAWVKNLFAPIVMYPGLAAAASLVLVAGITGVVYLSGQSMKSMMSEPRVAAPAAAPAKASEVDGKQALPGSAVRPRDPAAHDLVARDRVAADKAAADTADDAWGAEEQAALADTRAAEMAVQQEDRMPAEPMAGNVQGGLVGGMGKAGAAGPGGGDSEGMATGGGGFGSSGYDEANRSRSRARKSDSPAGAVERKEELRKGRAAPTARLYEGGELDEARQNRAPQTATSRDRSNAGARPYAQPPPPPPPSNAGVGVSAGVAVGRGGGAAAPAQKQTKPQKTKKAPAPARSAPGSASAPRQEPAPASAPAADEDAPAAEPEPEAAEAPRDRAPASKPKASTEASAGAPSKRARNDAGKDQGVQARVRDLHRKALAAAKKKDCDVVSNLARQVRELDASFYRSAFLGNKSLQACLGRGKNATKK